jgi:hypothetical protein
MFAFIASVLFGVLADRSLPVVVMAGLFPAIHAAPPQKRAGHRRDPR